MKDLYQLMSMISELVIRAQEIKQIGDDAAVEYVVPADLFEGIKATLEKIKEDY